MNRHKKATLIISGIVSKIYIITGIPIAVFCLLCVILGPALNSFSDVELYAVIITEALFSIATIAFAALAYKGFRRSKLNKMFKEYVAILSSDEKHSIEYLARVINKPFEDVAKNLQLMIDKHYFPAAFIDYNSNSLVLRSDFQKAPSAKDCIADRCKFCGASILIEKNKINTCQYCGSHLIYPSHNTSH